MLKPFVPVKQTKTVSLSHLQLDNDMFTLEQYHQYLYSVEEIVFLHKTIGLQSNTAASMESW